MNSHDIMIAIDEIAGTSSKNDKIELLQRHMADLDFLDILNLSMNPFVTYGQKPARYTGFAGNFMWNQGTLELLYSLADRTLTGSAAQAAINAEYTRLEEKSAELLWRVINKDLKAGFGENSVNKVKKGFIPSFPYMRCSLPAEAGLEEWAWSTGVISQIKADGMFFDANIDKTSESFTSRQGQPFPNTPSFNLLADNFRDAFDEILSGKFESGIQTHGELLVVDPSGEVLHRKIGNGMINKLIKGTEFPDGFKLTAVLWDIIPASSVTKKGKFEEPYLDRLRTLNSALGMMRAKRIDRRIDIIETKVVRSYQEAMDHYMDARRRKLEGTIVKKPFMIWKDGTSKDQVKLKQEVPVELEVYGFEEGKEGSKTSFTFGSLKCKTSDDMLCVDVGTGFSDELREEINANREDWIGSIITVKANEIMYATRGKLIHSLFLPVYVERRDDKFEADSFQRVEAQFEAAVVAA